MDMRYSDGRLDDPEYIKRPKYPVLIESLKVFLLFFAGCVLIFYAGYDLADGWSYAYYTLPFFLMPWISTVVRRLGRNIVLFIAVHLLLLAWIALSPHMILTTLSVIFWILLTLYGFVRKLSNEPEHEASTMLYIFSMLGMLCICVLAINRDRLGAQWAIAAMAFLYSVLYLFYTHWLGVHDALMATDEKSNFSVKRIIRFNNQMLAGYIGLALLGFGFLYFIGLDDLLAWLGAWLVRAIQNAGAYLNDVGGESEMMESMTVEDSGGPGLAVYAGESSPFWVILQNILEVVIVAVAVIAIVMAVYFMIKRFSQNYRYQEKNYEETKVFLKSVPKQKKKRRSLRSFLDQSPENKVRRAYYKLVRTQIGKKVKTCDTPEEVAEILPQVRDIVEPYEKARYAGQSIENHTFRD